MDLGYSKPGRRKIVLLDQKNGACLVIYTGSAAHAHVLLLMLMLSTCADRLPPVSER